MPWPFSKEQSLTAFLQDLTSSLPQEAGNYTQPLNLFSEISTKGTWLHTANVELPKSALSVASVVSIDLLKETVALCQSVAAASCGVGGR